MKRVYDRKEANFFNTLAKKYEIPQSTIEKICKHPFYYAKKIVVDKYDNKDILLGGLMRLKLKPAFKQKKESSFLTTSIKHRVNNSKTYLEKINPEYLKKQLKFKKMNKLITEFQHPLTVDTKIQADFSSEIFTIVEVRESKVDAGSLYAYIVTPGENAETQIVLDVDVVGIVENVENLEAEFAYVYGDGNVNDEEIPMTDDDINELVKLEQ